MTSSTCCGCIPVKAGVIALGVISLFAGMGDIIFGSIIVDSDCNLNGTDYNCNHNGNYNHKYNQEEVWYGTASIVTGSIDVMVSLGLIFGVSKRNPYLFMPYVGMMTVNIIAYIWVGVVLVSNTDYNDGAYYGIWYLCWSLILCYFVRVVHLYRVLLIQQILAANGLITTYPSGATLTPGAMINPYSSVAIVYTTLPGYTTQNVYPSGSYPQPGYPQQGYSYQPQQQGIYPPQNSYPPPYPGNQPDKS